MAISTISSPAALTIPGSVLQVVQGTTTTTVQNSTQTYADTTLTATITPKFATSKILVLISHPENYKSTASASNSLALKLVRNGSDVVEFTFDTAYMASSIYLWFPVSYNYLDSPASTSALAYKTQFKNAEVASPAVGVQLNSKMSTIILMEIAA
jgi:hypothetical protein